MHAADRPSTMQEVDTSQAICSTPGEPGPPCPLPLLQVSTSVGGPLGWGFWLGGDVLPQLRTDVALVNVAAFLAQSMVRV
eukprot:364520-Chlamydomonas_euryale.AAC.7